MASNVKPFPVVLLASVVALILSVAAYGAAGEAGLLGAALVLNIAVGLAVSLRWPLNPWRIGVTAVLPNIAFLLWRWISYTTPEDIALNTTLFIFLPVISLAASYFGGYLGRSMVIRRMKQAALQNK